MCVCSVSVCVCVCVCVCVWFSTFGSHTRRHTPNDLNPQMQTHKPRLRRCLFCNRGVGGGGGERVGWPPLASESKGRRNGKKNEYFKFKKIHFRPSKYFKLLKILYGNTIQGC